MKSIRDIRLSDCVIAHDLERYAIDRKKGESIPECLYRYLTENPIVKTERYQKVANVSWVKQTILRQMTERLEQKEKIQFFTTTFNPKPMSLPITNGQVFPDMGEMLSILHLSLISREMNKIYPYGFEFILGYEGSFFRNAGKFSKKTTDDIFQTLILYKETAERLLGQENLLVLFDVEQEIESFAREFYINIEKEKFQFLTELTEEYLNQTTQYYLDHVYDRGWFASDELAWDFCQYHALHGIAFNRAKFQGGHHDLGIMNNYPQGIRFCLKYNQEIKDELHLDLHPHFDTYPYNRLTVRTKEGEWRLSRWEHLNSGRFQPVFIEELTYAFYYQEL